MGVASMIRLAGRVLSAVVDPTVVLSFDRSGFLIHQLQFDPADTEVDMRGRTCLVTGANSGLGYATALGLARLGADVWLLCRDRERGQRALREIRRASGNNRVHLELADMSIQTSIRAFAERFTAAHVDVLVNNAGVLPDRRTETGDGLELTWATNVVGPFLLTHLLLPKLRAAPQGRVINVSSGGMYTRRLALEDLDWRKRPFDGVTAYAVTKRAEVILSEMWARRLAGTPVTVNSMHPGWADTPSVRVSLPRFYRVMQTVLRSAEQGADTIVWLAVCPRLAGKSGKFWFDRKARCTRYLPRTRETAAERKKLWRLCCQQCGVPADITDEDGGAEP
jgi:NAD(P)-dependent dehydrogenase (short-subunit alcohol dehydrogenase family)